MSAYAIYRLPHEDYATFVQQTEGEPAEFLSYSELNDRHGFVVAPFEVTPRQPILLIRPDRVERVTLSSRSEESGVGSEKCLRAECNLTPHSTLLTPRQDYAIDFANYHAQLKAGVFRKIVLARCAEEASELPIDPMELFHRACELYPRMFISLVSTSKSGVWLIATPEILLEGKMHDWHTVALAGTMKLEGDSLMGEGEKVTWATKDIQEQRIVTTYIAECLEQFTGDFREEGPRTVRAANLVHLRSDFAFTLPDGHRLGDLLHALHPTPAVCGLPKRETFNFIIQNEHTPRRYYSGFMGMLDPEGGTHLYVSLRCMNIEGSHYHLYAGGGLLAESTVTQEWLETEAKLETMRQCLAIKKM